MNDFRSAPKKLSPEAKGLWRKLQSEYDIHDAAGVQILAAGLEAFDRMRGAQEQIAKAGASFLDRFGQLRAHPLLPVERDARAAYLAALKSLNLDLEPLRDRVGRPGGS